MEELQSSGVEIALLQVNFVDKALSCLSAPSRNPGSEVLMSLSLQSKILSSDLKQGQKKSMLKSRTKAYSPSAANCLLPCVQACAAEMGVAGCVFGAEV